MSRVVIALDIGTKAAGSGWVCFESSADEHHPVDGDNTSVLWSQMTTNAEIIGRIVGEGRGEEYDFVFEGISSYGKKVGASTIGTCLWIGQMVGAIDATRNLGDPEPQIILRRVVSAHLVGARRPGDPTMDSMVARAVAERFGGMGATLNSVKGKKAAPGPCWGFHDDIWAAMAVGIAFVEGAKREEGWR